MHGRSTAATAWLSLTPEPERTLPELLALLVSNDLRRPVSSRGGRGHRSSCCAAPPAAGCRYLDRAADLALGSRTAPATATRSSRWPSSRWSSSTTGC